jgi:hypothetical protein
MTNASWIILAVVLIVFLYFLYQYLTTSTTTVSIANLNASIPPIASATIAGPTNMTYSYAAWVYVNSWNSNNLSNTPHALIYAPTGGSTASNAPLLLNGSIQPSYDNNGQNTSYDFGLFLDSASPTLYCALGATTLNSDTTSTPSNLITVSNNFPLQTWVYVVISVNSNVVDCYLNGKLVISQLIQQQGSIVTPSFSNIYLGNGSGPGWDAQLSNFKRYTTALTPQIVWSNYLSQAPNSFFLSSYGLQVDLTQNGSVTNTYKLF